jgi:hypothetical protein
VHKHTGETTELSRGQLIANSMRETRNKELILNGLKLSNGANVMTKYLQDGTEQMIDETLNLNISTITGL